MLVPERVERAERGGEPLGVALPGGGLDLVARRRDRPARPLREPLARARGEAARVRGEAASVAPGPLELADRVRQRARYPSTFRTARNASCGISTEPTCFMRFFPSFCFSRSLRLRLMSPP